MEGNSLSLLRTIGSGGWDDMVELCQEVKEGLPELPTSLAKDWQMRKLIEYL